MLPYVGDEAFCFTYGDGVADIDIGALIAFHREHGRLGDGHRRAAAGPLRRARDRRATASPASREKPRGDGGWINGGFFVLVARGRSTTSTATTRSGSGSRCERLAARRRSWRRSATTASGSRWTRCATSVSSRSCGSSGDAPWTDVGVDAALLARPARPRHRPHRLQGQLADALAARAGRRGHRPVATACRPQPSLFELAARRRAASTTSAADVRDADAVARGGRRARPRSSPPGRAAARAPLVRATRARPTRPT